MPRRGRPRRRLRGKARRPAEHARLDVPLADDLEEAVELLGAHDGHHALLALRHEDLLGGERRVAQQHLVEHDRHAAVAVRRELRGRARDAGRAEVLDALDQVAREQLEAALDEHLLGERVAHLHRGALGGAAFGEGVGCEDRRPADAVAARARAEQHHLVAGALGVGEVQVLVAEHADRERVDERVRLVHRVEPRLAADVRQAEAVAVERDAADHAVHDARRVGVGDLAEAQRVHDRDRAGAHRDDVAHDAADAGRGALERLDVARVVVRLDLERDRPALADVEHAGVLAHADHEVLAHLVGDLLAELAQVLLRRLVRAVLAPHDRVHGQLTARGAPPEDLADLLVLVGLQPERGVRLLLVGGGGSVLDGVEGGRGGNGIGHVGDSRNERMPGADAAPDADASILPPTRPNAGVGRRARGGRTARPTGPHGRSRRVHNRRAARVQRASLA